MSLVKNGWRHNASDRIEKGREFVRSAVALTGAPTCQRTFHSEVPDAPGAGFRGRRAATQAAFTPQRCFEVYAVNP